ncbi:hypothetical protein CKJ56_26250 [Mycobacterium intracellulare subsp. chimaera]|nr:hypothetical protein CKJ58_00405 [Mycobacterium intracellulare subsp. chimaera]PBA60180.1 hypothetical protein CKJ56_26250 [Mycobacterium intracellulare subsp. chimaera]
MSCATVRLSIGTRVSLDGRVFQITEFLTSTTGTEVILTGATSAYRMTLVALLTDDRAPLLVDETFRGTGGRA